MILGDIRNYMKMRKTVRLSEIATHFDISKESARLALDYWQRKGKVKPTATACNSSCGGCNAADENYTWVALHQPVQWYKISNQ